MKKILSLVLTLTLLVSMVSMSLAAVTVGGSIRTWFYSASDESITDPAKEEQQDAMGFQFDRLALKINADVSANNGIMSEISFRETDSNGSIKVDKAYYYQKGLFGEKDQLQVGYIELPFYNDKYSAITVQSLAYNLGPANSAGVKYVTAADNFDFAFALVNANNKQQTNANTNAKGEDAFDLALRVGFVPMENIKVGLGYASDLKNEDESYSKMVLDSNGQFGAIGYLFEYFSSAITKEENDYDGETLTGTYFEGSYKLTDTIKLYAGRGICLSGDDVDFAQYPGASGYVAKFAVSTDFKIDNDWTVIGCAFQIAPKTVLQPEYIMVDPVNDNSKTLIAARLRVDF